jgi:hypothetical protein
VRHIGHTPANVQGPKEKVPPFLLLAGDAVE